METAIIIVGIIILCLMGFGMRDFFANPDVHIGLRVGVGVIGGGVLWLVIRNIRARITRAKTEKAKEVEK
ncbi:MAG: hypothetical protein P8X92_01895 [Dehalococcoidia bacterium]